MSRAVLLLLCLGVFAASVVATPIGTFALTCQKLTQNSLTYYADEIVTLGDSDSGSLYIYNTVIYNDSSCSVVAGTLVIEGVFTIESVASGVVDLNNVPASNVYTYDTTWTSWTLVANTGFESTMEFLCSVTGVEAGVSFNLFLTGCLTLGLPVQVSCPIYYDILEIEPTYVLLGASSLIFGICNAAQRSSTIDNSQRYGIPYFAMTPESEYCPSQLQSTFLGARYNLATPGAPSANVSTTKNCLVPNNANGYDSGYQVTDSTSDTTYCCLSQGTYDGESCLSGCLTNLPLDSANPNAFFFAGKKCYAKCYLPY